MCGKDIGVVGIKILLLLLHGIWFICRKIFLDLCPKICYSCINAVNTVKGHWRNKR